LEFALVNGILVNESSLIPRANIHIKDGKIWKISGFQTSIDRDVRKVDVAGAYVSPGFIDLHVHGTGGYDSTGATHTALTGLRKAVTCHGVTTLAPTLLSSATNHTKTFLDAVQSEILANERGAKIVGAHLEGPFLNPSKKGVHLEENLRTPSAEAFDEITHDHLNLIKIMTIAPELEEALVVIGQCKNAGIVSSIGHSNATYNEATAGIQAGVSHSTHTFNSMSSLEARDPGCVGAILSSPNVYAEIIADGIHVHPSNVRLLLRTKGIRRTILITDAVRPAGTQMKEFEMGGIKATIRDGAALTSEGRLCGSTLTMDKAVRNVQSWSDLAIPEIVQMASLNPAKQLQIAEVTGSLVEGKDADIVILDKELKVKAMFVKGVEEYVADTESSS